MKLKTKKNWEIIFPYERKRRKEKNYNKKKNWKIKVWKMCGKKNRKNKENFGKLI